MDGLQLMFNKYCFLLLALFHLSYSQECINQDGNAVDWMVLLLAPATVSPGYLYYDSSPTRNNFTKFPLKPDLQHQPIHSTLSQINTLPNLDYIAWNDQNPNGSTSSVRAHSKNLLIFNRDTKAGIVIAHSMPKYPSFTQHIVSIPIPDGQRVYGQHFFCFKVSGKSMEEILLKTSVARLYIYESTFTVPEPIETEEFFLHSSFVQGNSYFEAIYKNGFDKKNASIFQDGLTLMFHSEILAQTWGRPSQLPWCGNEKIPYDVNNVEYLWFEDEYEWKRTKDHSKWAFPTKQGSDYACFGDMNRMSSQWTRGGMFYCVQSAGLKGSLKALVRVEEVCGRNW